jgi:hypothetical protein
MELMHAARQFATRRNDERFDNLLTLGAKLRHEREISRDRVVSSRDIVFAPAENDETRGLAVTNRNNSTKQALPTNFAFGQACALAGAPAGYLKTLPAPMVADALNYGLHHKRDVTEAKLLFRVNGKTELAAATGPNYGRVWNSDIADALIRNFGNGTTDSDWRAPGEFGEAVEITKANTTFFAGDRDMFVFLADEKNRIQMPGRRSLGMNTAVSDGSLARGFFVWNSEVGAATLGVAMFLFDYTCCNRIVWGAQGFREIKLRHTSGAPDRFVEQVMPVIDNMHNSSAAPVENTIKAAQAAKLDTSLAEFLKNRRYSTSTIVNVANAFEAEENRKIETVWDVVTGVTAHAKSIAYQDERVAMERDAGKILDLVAVR